MQRIGLRQGRQVSSTSGEQSRYVFETEAERDGNRPPRRRTRHDAERALATLRARLHVPEAVVFDAELSRSLLRFCTDVVLNIEWYERARRREEANNRRTTTLMVVIMAVALVLLFVSSVLPTLRPGSVPTYGALQLTVFAGGVLTVLQIIAALGDGKARLTIFWKASADLKELLYTFERTWRDQCIVSAKDGAFTPASGFVAAVEDTLRTALAITRAERLDFFATLRSPSDVVAIAATAAESLRGRRTEAVAATAKHEDTLAEARRALTTARAAVAASEYRLGALPDGAAKDAERIVLVNAKAEVVRTEKVLGELVAM